MSDTPTFGFEFGSAFGSSFLINYLPWRNSHRFWYERAFTQDAKRKLPAANITALRTPTSGMTKVCRSTITERT